MGRYEAKYISGKPPVRARRRKKSRAPLIAAVCLVLSAAVAAVLFFTLRKDPLQGRWLYGTTVYSFDGRGEGSMVLPEEAYAFTYDLSGETLTMDFEDPRLSDASYGLTFREDKLILSGRESLSGNFYELTKEIS